MAVLSGFDERAEVLLATRRPKLPAAFEPSLPLQARRFYWPGTDGPATLGDPPIVQAAGMSGKIILFPSNHFAAFPAAGFEAGDGS